MVLDSGLLFGPPCTYTAYGSVTITT